MIRSDFIEVNRSQLDKKQWNISWHFQFQVQLNVTEIALLGKYLWIKILSASSTSNKIYLNSNINKMIVCPGSACNKAESTEISCLALFNSLTESFHLHSSKWMANSASQCGSFCGSFSVLQKNSFETKWRKAMNSGEQDPNYLLLDK